MARQSEKSAETEAPNRYSTFNNNRGWLYGLAVLIILILVFMAGVGIANHRQRHDAVFGGGYGTHASGMGPFGRRIGMSGDFGGTGTDSGQTRTSGVVINVNGANFTLAGNGATTNVATTSSTQYHGGDQVKQNDSVIVFGTTSNGTLNATQVVINP